MKQLKTGILKERKIPHDFRTPLTPDQAVNFQKYFPFTELVIESSDVRCYKDEEYKALGIKVVDDVSDCDVLIGIKEVPVEYLSEDKTYFFFSHTIKKQTKNHDLLQAMVNKNIRMIDYETITDERGVRMIAFGHYAGLVGAHYSLLMLGEKSGKFRLKKAIDCHDLEEMTGQYKGIDFGNTKFLITGTGRVAKGAAQILKSAGIKEVSVDDYLSKEFDFSVFCHADADTLYKPNSLETFTFEHFFQNPGEYLSDFGKFTTSTDVLINCIYWDPRSPVFFEKHEIQNPLFKINLIADISCDLDGSIPLTHHITGTENPFFGVSRKTLLETEPFQADTIDVMAIDNLPSELPRDASAGFGKIMLNTILPLFFNDPEGSIFERATICENGSLTARYSYLQDWLDGKE